MQLTAFELSLKVRGHDHRQRRSNAKRAGHHHPISSGSSRRPSGTTIQDKRRSGKGQELRNAQRERVGDGSWPMWQRRTLKVRAETSTLQERRSTLVLEKRRRTILTSGPARLGCWTEKWQSGMRTWMESRRNSVAVDCWCSAQEREAAREPHGSLERCDGARGHDRERAHGCSSCQESDNPSV